MKNTIETTLTLLLGFVSFAQAQQSAIIEDFKPSVLNQPQQEYPMVNSQGYARFKINSPVIESKNDFFECWEQRKTRKDLEATAKLKEAGFNAVSYVSEKTGHEFLTWRRSLLAMAPLLFK